MPPTMAMTITMAPAIHGHLFLFLISMSSADGELVRFVTKIPCLLEGGCGGRRVVQGSARQGSDEAVARELDDLDGDDQRDHRGDHDVVVETVVAVGNRQVAHP